LNNIFSQEDWGIVLELLGAHNVLPYKGGWRSSCPIHRGDGDKAFAVWVDEGGMFRASCHSHQCVKAASLEWVVAKAQNKSLKDAVEWLGTQLGRALTVPDGMKHDILLMPKMADDISFCDIAALERLRATYPYHSYWEHRGYSKALVDEYRLTYRGMDQRMVIPMFDDDNRFVGMMTRTLDPNDPIKYKWESPNSRKAHWLYGVPQALKRPLMVNGRRTVFVVEGTLDVLHATECGFPVVASQTNRLSADQVQQLVSNWDLVLLIPDNDEPGKNLVKDAKKLVAPFLEVGVVILPKGVKDLDEMPTLDLPAFLNTAISEWRTTWQIAPRRQRSFLTLNPSVSAVLALEQSAKLSGICAIA
jgi:hypothetical protein